MPSAQRELSARPLRRGPPPSRARRGPDALLMSAEARSLTAMDSESWIIATDSGSYWGRSWGADGVTFVRANAHRYPSRAQAASKIAELGESGDERAYHPEQVPPGRRYRY